MKKKSLHNQILWKVGLYEFHHISQTQGLVKAAFAQLQHKQWYIPSMHSVTTWHSTRTIGNEQMLYMHETNSHLIFLKKVSLPIYRAQESLQSCSANDFWEEIKKHLQKEIKSFAYTGAKT